MTLEKGSQNESAML
jgi:hypothetical protein